MIRKSKASLILIMIALMILFTACQTVESEKEPETIAPEVAVSLEQYMQGLSSAYDELNKNYDTYKSGGNLEEWKSFSSEWLVAIQNTKHEIEEDRIDKAVRGKLNVLENVKESMVAVWQGYNEIMNERPFENSKIEKDKKVVETLLKKLTF